jgi:GDP/GTP exchange factor required for growth at low temperature
MTDDEVDLEIEASSRTRGPSSRPFIPNSPPRIRVREQHRDLPSSPPQASSDRLAPHLEQHGSVSRAVSSTVSRFKRLMHRPASSVIQGKRASPYDDPKFSSLSEAQLVSDHGHCSPSLLHSSLASPTSSSGLQTSSESDFRSSSTSVESNTSVDGLGISEDQPTALRHSQSSQTIKTDSKQAPRLWSLSRVSYASGVQLDDVGFSDDSDEELGEDFPRTLRRLPAARDLRHANALRHLHSNLKVAHSSDSMSSAGTTREPPHLFFQPTSSSRASQASESSEYGGPGPAVILNFVVDGLESDEEEDAGDVEAALRRLEGQIDGDRQKQNAVKVEEQMAKSKARAEHGDTDEIIEEDDGCYSDSPMSPVEEVEAHPAAQEPRLSTVVLPPRSNLQAVQSKSRLSAFRNSIGRKPSVKALARGSMSKASDSRLGMPALVRSLADPPHRSFVLFCKTTQLAKQFALIERDLFCNIGWHE